MPRPSVYNLCWYRRKPGDKTNPLLIARHETSTVSEHQRIGVVILYPTLATPEILVGDDPLELLLLTQHEYPDDRLRMRIREQLKFTHGLDASKMVSEDVLFIDPQGKHIFSTDDRKIAINKLPFIDRGLISTPSGRFSGYVDRRAFRVFSDAGYTTLYSVSMSNKVFRGSVSGNKHSACGEPHDEVMKTVLARHNDWAAQKGNYYCFRDGGDDVDHTAFDTDDPIQSYHPVYYYTKGDFYANIAHHSDIHVSARQQVMHQTKARVIDYADAGNDVYDESPTIGSRVDICSKDMKQILTKLGSSGADILAIGGDLVDYIRSCYPSRAVMKQVADGKPSSVWKVVGVDHANYTTYYKDGVDLIAFFSILIKFLREHPMPAYAITGNHDCYFEPYGILPLWSGHLTNKGIPADHNLTPYEATLAFGRTWGALLTGRDTSFLAERFDWFYTVFTPFSDYLVELPKQRLAAFGWGDREDFFDFVGGQFLGHLPRAKDCVSEDQLTLLKLAIGKPKRVILITHFTFVSYDDSITVNTGDTNLGRVYCSPAKNYNEFNNGTFEKARNPMLLTHCGERHIQVILTGHSHRRALYLVDHPDPHGRDSVVVRHLEFTDALRHPAILEPAIVVSDSGGTIPRYNFSGEFNGWGSDPPSGTVVEFEKISGRLDKITAQRCDCRPRAAAALDFCFVVEKKNLFASFKSNPFPIGADRDGTLTSLTFTVTLNWAEKQMGWLWGFSIESISFFANWEPGKWWRISLDKCASDTFEISSQGDVQAFAELFVDNGERTNFISMKLAYSGGLSRCDVGDAWCWEFRVRDKEVDGKQKSYLIERNRDFAMSPDFDTRSKFNPAKYS